MRKTRANSQGPAGWRFFLRAAVRATVLLGMLLLLVKDRDSVVSVLKNLSTSHAGIFDMPENEHRLGTHFIVLAGESFGNGISRIAVQFPEFIFDGLQLTPQSVQCVFHATAFLPGTPRNVM
ncbi:MAG: hypothetical protein V3S83_12445 [Gemmatimonadota bacterium]